MAFKEIVTGSIPVGLTILKPMSALVLRDFPLKPTNKTNAINIYFLSWRAS